MRRAAEALVTRETELDDGSLAGAAAQLAMCGALHDGVADALARRVMMRSARFQPADVGNALLALGIHREQMLGQRRRQTHGETDDQGSDTEREQAEAAKVLMEQAIRSLNRDRISPVAASACALGSALVTMSPSAAGSRNSDSKWSKSR